MSYLSPVNHVRRTHRKKGAQELAWMNQLFFPSFAFSVLGLLRFCLPLGAPPGPSSGPSVHCILGTNCSECCAVFSQLYSEVSADASSTEEPPPFPLLEKPCAGLHKGLQLRRRQPNPALDPGGVSAATVGDKQRSIILYGNCS